MAASGAAKRMSELKRRLFFPNLSWRLKLMPPPNARNAEVAAMKTKEGATFQSSVLMVETRDKSLTKIEMRQLLEKLYPGLKVLKVDALNVLGKRKRVFVDEIKKAFDKKLPDFKRFYVHLRAPVEVPYSPASVPDLLRKLGADK
mmetsp:Transcript_55099/g.135140  ORF Transcript_55099/g.135140 Transcript_55099/m.135140 type:complete len:145 (-) Transcript_55099:881-1315(-)